MKLTSETDASYASSLDFTTAGSYSVTLRVTDSDGGTQTAIATVTVVGDPISSTIYFEDFQDETANAAFCSSPYDATPYVSTDGQWTYTCPSVGNLYVFAVPSGATGVGFNWYQNQDAGVWLSSSIDISNYLYVDISTLIFDNDRLENGEGIQLYAIIDGVESLVDSDTDGTIIEGDSLTASGLSGSTLQVKISSTCYSAQQQSSKVEETWVDNIRVRGYCVDADMNGICDSEQACVDVPAGTCGCLDKTACTYDASATSNDPDQCVYAGGQCQDPDGGQYFFYDLTCSCTAETFTSLYMEDFGPNGAAGGQGTAYGYLGSTDVNGASAETEWTLSFDGSNIADGNTGNGVGPDYWRTIFVEDGGGTVIDTVFDGLNLGMEARWTTKSIDVSSYAWARFQAEISEDMMLESDDYIRVELIEDGTELNTALDSIVGNMPDPDWPTYQITDVVRANAASNIQLQIAAKNNDCLPCPGDNEYHTFDDVEILGWGIKGCTDPGASQYSSAAEVDDATCTFTAMAYSRYDGGFTDKLWQATECAAGGCGSAPFPLARSVDAASQDATTTQCYTISSGTTLTVDGTSVASDDPTITELFVKDLTIQPGGALVIPDGKRLRVMGTFTDQDGDAISGDGCLCVDGTFSISNDEALPDGTPLPSVINVQDFIVGASISIGASKTLAVNGDITFSDLGQAPDISGLIDLAGTSEQTISGTNVTFDRLQISNTSGGVTAAANVEVQDRLTISDSGILAMGANTLVFASNASTGTEEEEKTGVLDMIPSNATFSGPAGQQAQSTGPTVQVERYFASDTDGTTTGGYSMYASPISGATVGDLDNIDGFYLTGWTGTDWPNAISSILFWDESTSSFETPTANSTSLSGALGTKGTYVAISGSQNPTLVTSGSLNSHVQGDSKGFGVTRTSTSATTLEYRGWNMIYNPYQARLDWDQVIGNAFNAAIIEDQYAIYDTQSRQFVRYSKTNSDAEYTTSAQCIEPGQSFWVRVKDNSGGGSLTILPDYIDNDGPEAEFVRSSQEGEATVIIETENAFGATRSLIRFREDGVSDGFAEGDLSRISSSSVKRGELAVVADGERYVAKSLPYASENEIYVRSRTNYLTTMRVVSVTGDPGVCAHITDHQTGAVLLLQEGEEIEFTLASHDAPEGRFTLQSEPFALATGLAPSCPDAEDGWIVVELGEAVADLTVVNYATLDVVNAVPGVTGTVEISASPGEYAILVDAQDGTTLCRGGRRQVVVFPGEVPELLGLEPMPAECNGGDAALAFELYGGGEFQTSLWQGSETVWEETLMPGEHVIDGVEPGQYVLKVDHACYEANELVSLLDPGLPEIAPVYSFFTEVEPNGQAWIEASCAGCMTGDGFGYQWYVDGVLVETDEDLGIRVDEIGTYDIELVAYGPDCEVTVLFEMLVGKHKVMSPDAVRWMGIQDGTLGAIFDEEWVCARLRWYDATGRLLLEEQPLNLLGEVFLTAPDAVGWLTLDVMDAEGRRVRWSGVK